MKKSLFVFGLMISFFPQVLMAEETTPIEKRASFVAGEYMGHELTSCVFKYKNDSIQLWVTTQVATDKTEDVLLYEFIRIVNGQPIKLPLQEGWHLEPTPSKKDRLRELFKLKDYHHTRYLNGVLKQKDHHLGSHDFIMLVPEYSQLRVVELEIDPTLEKIKSFSDKETKTELPGGHLEVIHNIRCKF